MVEHFASTSAIDKVTKVGLAARAHRLHESTVQLRALLQEVPEVWLHRFPKCRACLLLIRARCSDDRVGDEVGFQTVFDIAFLRRFLCSLLQIGDRVKSPDGSVRLPGNQHAVEREHWLKSGLRKTIGVMTAMGESGLANLEHGDAAGADSRGLFQQRANGAWGSLKDRMTPYTAAYNFFTAHRSTCPLNLWAATRPPPTHSVRTPRSSATGAGRPAVNRTSTRELRPPDPWRSELQPDSQLLSHPKYMRHRDRIRCCTCCSRCFH
jgi:hypothetical protein